MLPHLILALQLIRLHRKNNRQDIKIEICWRDKIAPYGILDGKRWKLEQKKGWWAIVSLISLRYLGSSPSTSRLAPEAV